MANISGIGQSALAAAQLGIATTGHNIANASTPGYNRQQLLQTAAAAQNFGGSFVGQGVEVGQIRRVYNEFLSQQVNLSQSTRNFTDSYASQIRQINNLVADSTTGVSPALQDFFKSIQNLSSSPNGTAGAAARQSVLSSAESLTSRIQGLQSRLDQIRESVGNQIQNSVTSINSFAGQISRLNDAIEKSASVSTGAPNDLLDQRDKVITELSKLTNVTVVPQGTTFNVFIGSGQPLVLGTTVNKLQTTSSLTDPSRIEVAYENNGTLIQLPENALTGGSLGGLFSFRANTLDVAQNSIGRVAIGLAVNINEQHRLGQDLNGQQGGNLFSIGSPVSLPSAANTTTANIAASITDASALTTSDYRVQFIAGNYKITRLSDGVSQTTGTLPIVVDGVSFNSAPPPAAATPANGDEFLVKPTANGASSFRVAIQDTSRLAAGAPVNANAPTTNTGSGKISAGSVDSLVASSSNSTTATISATTLDDNFSTATTSLPITLSFASPANTLSGFPAGSPVTVKVGNVTTVYPAPVTSVPYTSGATINVGGVNFKIQNSAAAPANGDTFTLSAALPVANTRLTFSSATNTLSGFPATANVTVTNGSTSTTYPAGTPVPFTAGSTVSYQGLSFVVSGVPNNADVFNIGQNPGGTGDNRNALLLSSIQSKNTLVGSSTSFQGAYGQFVSLVGNKANELEVTSAAENQLLTQAVQAQQSESGVNLDEEAANLLRYQQAYQAAGKLLQISSQLFDSLLALGR